MINSSEGDLLPEICAYTLDILLIYNLLNSTAMGKRHLINSDHELETKWNTIKETFVQEYSCLTPNDLNYGSEGFDKLLHHLGQKMGVSESKLRKMIGRWDDSWLHFF